MTDLTCIHCPSGLCPDCREDYDEDPSAWYEFGGCRRGVRRWQELQDEMEAERVADLNRKPVKVDDSIPF